MENPYTFILTIFFFLQKEKANIQFLAEFEDNITLILQFFVAVYTIIIFKNLVKYTIITCIQYNTPNAFLFFESLEYSIQQQQRIKTC